MGRTFVVVGGGISGLATAYYLKRKLENSDGSDSVLLLEKAHRVGGHIQTVKEKGFIFEGGPRGFLADGRRTLALCKDLGIWDQLQISSDLARIRYVWKNQKLNPLPSGPKDIFTSKMIGWKELKTVFGEYFKRNKPGIEDESVAEFIIRRFSEDILDNFVELLISGVYAGNPKRLSAKSLFPRLKELESQYGSILKGLLKSKKKKEEDSFDPEIMAIAKRKLVSFNEGMETLSQAIAHYLGDSLCTSAEIKNIHFSEEGKAGLDYEHDGIVKQVSADKVFFATPSFVTAEWIRPLSEELSQLLSEVEYAHIHVAGLGYHGQVHSNRGFGFLSPRKENLKMLGCIFNEMVFPTMAEGENMNLTAMYGGACHSEMKDWDANTLLSETGRELGITLGIGDEPDIVKVFLYKQGIPQYNIGHNKRIQRILEILEKNPHIYLIGSYINGVGINDCVKNSFELINKMEL